MPAAVVYLCGELMATTLFAAAQPDAILTYLLLPQRRAGHRRHLRERRDLLRRRVRGEERYCGTSGTSLTFAAVLVTALAYTVLGAVPLL